MNFENRFEILKWYLERSDKLRSGYSTKAAVLLSANVLLTTGIFFLLEKIIITATDNLKFIIVVFVSFSLFLTFLSILSSIFAIASYAKRSRKFTKLKGSPRYFLNPSESINKLREVKYQSPGDNTEKITIEIDEPAKKIPLYQFEAIAKSISPDSILKSLIGELWVALYLQDFRYKMLKTAIFFFFIAFMFFIVGMFTSIYFKYF